jgi:RHS repeat-associated protein
MTAPGQPAVAYGYDAASRLTSISQDTQLVDLRYDSAGRRTLLTLPNRVTTAYRWDPTSRLSALVYSNTAGPLGDLAYQYDATGNRVAVSGSLARTLLPDPVVAATYDAANRQLAFGDRLLTYDANGNMTSITDSSGTKALVWDARNRLIRLTTTSTDLQWIYDAQGRRVHSRVGVAEAHHLYDRHDIVQTHTLEGTTAFLRTLAIDETLGRDATNFYLTDALGSTVALTDAGGFVTTRYLYEPFGRTLSEGAESPNAFQFTGRENDGAIGVYAYRSRIYSSALHRFVSEDPLGWLAGVNNYVYAENNPLAFRDPHGLDVEVQLYGGEGFNRFGHIAVAVNNGTAVGLYPAAASVRVALGATVSGVVKLDQAPPRTVLTIPASPAQDSLMQQVIDAALGQPPPYNYYVHNCTHFVAEVLRAGGIQFVNPGIPALLMRDLQVRYGVPIPVESGMVRPIAVGVR